MKSLIMKLRKPVIDKKEPPLNFLQQMTSEERRKFEEKCQKQLNQTGDLDLIDILKTRPASINFDTYEDMNKFLEEVRADKYDM